MTEQTLRDLVYNLKHTRAFRALICNLSALDLGNCTEELLSHVDVHLAYSRFQEADILLRLAHRLASRAQDPELIKKINRKRNTWLEAQNMHWQSAKRMRRIYANRSKNALNQEQDRAELGSLLIDITLALSHAGKPGLAAIAAQKAYTYFQQNDDDYNMITTEFDRASLMYDSGRYQESIALCTSILPRAEKYQEVFANVLLQLANNLEAINLPNRACQFYGQAMSVYHKLGNYKQQADISYRIGWIMLRRDHFEIAARCLRTAFFIKMEIEYKKALMRRNFLEGQAYYGCGLTAQARRSFLLTLIYAEQLKDNTYLTLARHGFYKTRGNIQINLRSAMTAASVDGQGGWNFELIPGGFRRYSSEGYAVPPYPERVGYIPSSKEQQSLRNLLSDLTFCSGAVGNTLEAIYFHLQQEAFS